MTNKQILEDAIKDPPIKRFGLSNNQVRIIEFANGEFVKFSDYELLLKKLEKEKAIPMKYKRMEHNARLQSEIETLRAELTKARQWIDCSVELPKDEKSVLVTDGLQVNKTCFYDGAFLMPSKHQSDAITHWQPLPLPPNAQQERN